MNDVELGPDEMSVIAAARQADAPSELQRARVRKGLDAKLAAGVAAPLLAGSTAVAMAGKVGVGIVMVAAVGVTTAYVAMARPPRQPPAAVQTVPPPAMPATTMTPEPPIEMGTLEGIPNPPAVTTAAPRPLPVHPRGTTRRREASPALPADLTGELALLNQASAATKHGDVTRADELLRAYDQRFASGQLTQERAAAGILLLCASNRVQAARTEAHRFLERWPRSPLVARINSSCAVEAKAP
jgi:hypothetical protein